MTDSAFLPELFGTMVDAEVTHLVTRSVSPEASSACLLGAHKTDYPY